MKIFRSFKEASKAKKIRQLALGFFDGLHRGHRTVIFPKGGHQNPQECAVLTFSPHPISVINPSCSPPLITGWPHKLKILEEWNLGAVLILPFDRERSLQPAQGFLKDIEVYLPKIRHFSVGANFYFGYSREGNLHFLQQWGVSKKAAIHIAERLQHDQEAISSSRIRREIQNGHLKQVEEMLGRPFSLFGEVVEGLHLGAKLGFPTANLKTEDECLPPPGVYSGLTRLADGSQHLSAINMGWRPSIASQQPEYTIESHLLNFSGNLYGQHIHIIPQKKIRSERKFSSLEELHIAIRQDISLITQRT